MHERAAHREIDVDSLMKGRRRREPPHWAGRSFIYRVAGLGVGLGFLTDAEELCNKKPVCGPTPAPISPTDQDHHHASRRAYTRGRRRGSWRCDAPTGFVLV